MRQGEKCKRNIGRKMKNKRISEKQEGLSPLLVPRSVRSFPLPLPHTPPFLLTPSSSSAPSELRTQSVSCACPPASALRTPCLDFEFIFIPLTPIFLVHNGYACTLYLWIENHLEKGEKKPERKSIRPIPWRCSMQSRSKRPRRTRAGTR